MFGRFGLGELILILLIALVIFGPKKLPEIGKSLGEAIQQFKGTMSDSKPAAEESQKPSDGSN